jgi:hypothetical protein
MHYKKNMDFFFKEHLHKLTKKEHKDAVKQLQDLLYTLKEEEEDEEEEEEDEEKEEELDREVLSKYNLFEDKNFYIYKIYKHIVDILMTTKDFIIYGGYLRDNILHDYMASIFYENDILLPTFDSDADKFLFYNDPKVDPKTSLRTLVPKDIDIVFLSLEAYTIFEDKLKAKCYIIKTKIEDPYHDDPNKDTDTQRLKIFISSNAGVTFLLSCDPKLIAKEYASVVITIDVTISNVYVPTSDFLCNSLMITSNGFVWKDPFVYQNVTSAIGIVNHKVEFLKEIQSQIHNMEAVCYQKDYSGPVYVQKHRMEKMVRKGWRIIFKNSKGCLTQINQAQEIDVCMVCREEFKEINNVPGFSKLYDGVAFGCCKCGYHPRCLAKLLENNSLYVHLVSYFHAYKCIQCSKYGIVVDAMSDLLNFLINLEYAFRIVLE